MFYEEKTIKNILNCELCNERLDQPKKLPCGGTICTSCAASLQIVDNQFECSICSEKHLIDSRKGLPTCKMISSILSVQPTEISRGNAVEALKANLNELRQKMLKLNMSINNGVDQIKEHCINLRTNIQLSTEQCIEQINEFNKELINTVDSYEVECIRAYEQKQHNENIFMQFVEELDHFMNEWSEYLKRIDIREETILRGNQMAKQLAVNADKQYFILENHIFNGNLLKFERSKLETACFLGRLESRFSSLIISSDLMKDLMLMAGFPVDQRWRLLYRGTRDGFKAIDFHSKCDPFKQTLAIIKSTTGHVFGGYTDQDWSGKCYKIDSNAFIFSLINLDKKPLVMKCLPNQTAICCSDTIGVTFGNNSSCDILVCDESNVKKESGSNLGSSFEHPKYEFDTDEANAFLAGSMYFQTLEIEVFCKI